MALTAAFLALGLAACGDDDAPGRSSIEVDTPKLQKLKAEAGIEPCTPGPGGGALPSLTLPCLGGGDDVDLASLKGPMIINLWTSNCAPCRKEMPVLQEFHEKYGDRVAVVGIDVIDTYPEAAIALAEHTGATYPQLADPDGDIYEQKGLDIKLGLPQFVLLDADGEVAGQSAGGVDELAAVTDLVAQHLGITL